MGRLDRSLNRFLHPIIPRPLGKDGFKQRKVFFMTYLIHDYFMINITPTLHSGTEKQLTGNQCLPEQNPSDGEPDCLWEPPVVRDEEAEAAYKVWQESLSYLQEDIERL
jgi:hypothetical protein